MKIRLISLLCVTAALTACGGSGGESSESTSTEKISTTTKPTLRSVFLDDVGIFPVSKNSKGSYTLNLNNISDENYTVESVTILHEDEKLVGINSAVCTSLAAKGYCSIQVTPHKPGNVLLTVKLRNSKNELKILKQLIRMSDQITGRGINFKSGLGRTVTPDGNYSISVPIVLDKDFKNVKATFGNLLCTGFTAGNTCTLTMKGKSLGKNTLVTAHLIGYDASGKELEVDEDTTEVVVSDIAHLIISHGTEVKVGTPSKIKVFNNGGGIAKNVVKKVEGNALQIAQQECTGDILPNDICEFTVSSNSLTHGEALVTVGYNNGKFDDNISTKVSYLASKTTANLEISQTPNEPYIDFENLLAGSAGVQNYTIKNNGTAPIENFKLELVSNPGTMKASASTTQEGRFCSAISTLDPGQECHVAIHYEPKLQSQDKGVALVRLRGSYKTVEGVDKPYLKWQDIKYSAISGANLLSLIDRDGNNSLIVTAGSSETKTYELEQTSAFTTTILNPKVIATPEIDDLVIKEDGACNNLNNIDKKCNVLVTYSPPRSLGDTNNSTVLSAEYDLKGPNGSIHNGRPDFISNGLNLALTTVSAITGKVDPDVSVADPAMLISGDGISEPYFYNASKTKQLELQYTFTNNTGNKITNFYLDNSNLDSKLEITGCGNGELYSIEAHSSCVVKVMAPSKSWLENYQAIYAPNQPGVSLITGQFNIPLTFHYNGIKDIVIRNVKFNRDSAKVTYKMSTLDEEKDNYVATIEATAGAENLDHDVKVSVIQSGAETADTCTITANGSKHCDIKVSFPKSYYDNMDKTALEIVATETSEDKDPITTIFDIDFRKTTTTRAFVADDANSQINLVEFKLKQSSYEIVKSYANTTTMRIDRPTGVAIDEVHHLIHWGNYGAPAEITTCHLSGKPEFKIEQPCSSFNLGGDTNDIEKRPQGLTIFNNKLYLSGGYNGVTTFALKEDGTIDKMELQVKPATNYTRGYKYTKLTFHNGYAYVNGGNTTNLTGFHMSTANPLTGLFDTWTTMDTSLNNAKAIAFYGNKAFQAFDNPAVGGVGVVSFNLENNGTINPLSKKTVALRPHTFHTMNDLVIDSKGNLFVGTDAAANPSFLHCKLDAFGNLATSPCERLSHKGINNGKSMRVFGIALVNE